MFTFMFLIYWCKELFTKKKHQIGANNNSLNDVYETTDSGTECKTNTETITCAGTVQSSLKFDNIEAVVDEQAITQDSSNDEECSYQNNTDCNFNLQFEGGKTTLHHLVTLASKTEQKDVVKTFRRIVSQHTVDVNIQDDYKQTPLHIACINLKDDLKGDIKSMIEILVNSGQVDVNLQDIDGRTPLHLAVKHAWPLTNDKVEIISKLVNMPSCDVNIVDKFNKTPLHYTVFKTCKFDIIKCLVRKDVNLDIKDESGFNVLHYAAMKANRGEVIKFLLKRNRADVNIRDNSGKTCLHIATSRSTKEAIVDKLLSSPIDINAKDKFGKTAFHYVCSKKNKAKMMNKFLKHRNIDVNIKDNDNKTALHYVAKFAENTEALKVLLNHPGIQLFEKDETKKTPLHYCSMIRAPEMLLLLLDLPGIDVTVTDDAGRTALHYCAAVGADLNIVDKLITLDSNILMLRDNKGDLALDISKRHKHEMLTNFLIEKSPAMITRHISIDQAEIMDILNDHDNSLLKEILVKKRDKLKDVDRSGKTIIHLIASSPFAKHRVEALELILNSKLVEINAQDCDGRTALHYAVKKTEKIEIVKCLLKFKTIIDVNILDNKRKSAIMFACAEALECLLSRGASVDMVDNLGRTVLHYCCKAGHSVETVKSVLEHKDMDDDLKTRLDLDGSTAFYLAQNNNHKLITSLLQEYGLGYADELTVSHLKHTDIEKLNVLKTQVLDQFCWEKLCCALVQRDHVKITDEEIDLLKYPGCRAMGQALIDHLLITKPDFTTTDLLNIAKKNKREDICLVLNNVPTLTLNQIDYDMKFRLSILCSRQTTVANCEVLAECCGCSESEINNITTAGYAPHEQKNSVQEMFKVIKTYNSSLKLKDLHGILQDTKLNNAAQILMKIIKEKEGRSRRNSFFS